jgi:sugar/nucleoside kinase (ribokinase family)
MIDIVVVGHIGTDTVRTLSLYGVSLGGAGYHAAIGALQSGASVGIVSRVGHDYPLATVSKLGVDTAGVRSVDGSSSRFDITYMPSLSDRVVSYELGVGEFLSIDDFPQEYLSAKFVHIATNLPRNQLSFLRTLRKTSDAILTVDCFDQFIVADPSGVAKVLRECDLYFANEDEERLIAAFAPTGKPHIVKRGASGAAFYEGDYMKVEVPAPHVQVVDPTGAGDIFAGAFLGYRCSGLDESSAMDAACRLAALSVQGVGSSMLTGLDIASTVQNSGQR